MTYHIIRYKFFYDNSSRKHNCTYSKMTYIKFWEENEKDKILFILKTKGLDLLTSRVEQLERI